MQIYQLPQLTSIGAAAVVPVESGTTTYKATVGDLTGFDTLLTLSNTQDITVSVDALTVGRSYDINITSYGNQSASGVPENANYVGTAYCNHASYKQIEIRNISNGKIWLKVKSNGTWGNWIAVGGNLETFSATQDITVTADALPTNVARTYIGYLNSINNQETCGVPVNANFLARITIAGGSTKFIELTQLSYNGSSTWTKCKTSNGWGPWQMRSGYIEGTITKTSLINSSDIIKCVQMDRIGIIQCASRIVTAGTYDSSNVLFTSSIKPMSTFSAVMLIGSNHTIVRITTSGAVSFNSSTTVAANNYLIGQITFPAAN